MARTINRLSDKSVQAKKAKGFYPDGGGLYLPVNGATSKSWVFRFKRDGRARDMGLGSLTPCQPCGGPQPGGRSPPVSGPRGETR